MDDSEKTYVCTCYGTSHLQVKDVLEISEFVTTSHHDQPSFIYFGEKRIEQAPVINHSDQELILLEKLVAAFLLSKNRIGTIEANLQSQITLIHQINPDIDPLIKDS